MVAGKASTRKKFGPVPKSSVKVGKKATQQDDIKKKKRLFKRSILSGASSQLRKWPLGTKGLIGSYSLPWAFLCGGRLEEKLITKGKKKEPEEGPPTGEVNAYHRVLERPGGRAGIRRPRNLRDADGGKKGEPSPSKYNRSTKSPKEARLKGLCGKPPQSVQKLENCGRYLNDAEPHRCPRKKGGGC